MNEMYARNIKFKQKYIDELLSFVDCGFDPLITYSLTYPEHNNKYLMQCIYNLEEKYDRGIISDKEWAIIINNIKPLIKNVFREVLYDNN